MDDLNDWQKLYRFGFDHFFLCEKGRKTLMRKTTLGLVSVVLILSVMVWKVPVSAVDISNIETNAMINGQVEAGKNSTFFIDELNMLWAWGNNEFGQLGDGNYDR
jgi:hypothetical protein